MTTTNVFCGLGDKSTSKVLKPPGGGHTDIFGAPDPPVKRDMGRNASSILEGTSTNMSAPSPTKPSQPPPKITPPEESAPSAPSSRTKVPPGGFSSGPLW